MLLGFSRRHGGEPQHKSLSFSLSCNRNPEETPLESPLQEVNYWTPTLWLWPVLAFGSTMKSWVAKQLAHWQLQLREDHCAHDGSSVSLGVCCCCCCLWRCGQQTEPVRGNSLPKPSFCIWDSLSHSEECFWSRLKHARWRFDRNDRNGMPSCFLLDSLSSNYTIIRRRRQRWRQKMKLWLWGHGVDNRGVSRGS